jgi:hypothetical protein
MNLFVGEFFEDRLGIASNSAIRPMLLHKTATFWDFPTQNPPVSSNPLQL